MKKLLTLFLISSIALAEEVQTTNPIYITAEQVEITDGMVSNDKISQDEITSNPNRNIAEITRVLPNVERSGSVRGSNSEFKIRGMEDTRITTKIDGSKTNFRGEYKGRNFISPFMLSGISVVRGSNSVMEGSGSIAGSVNLRTKEVEDIALNPDAKKGSELFSSYSTNGNMQNYGGATFVKSDGYSLLGLYSLAKNNDFKMAEATQTGSGTDTITKNIDYTKNTVNNGMLKFKKEFSENEFLKLTSSFFSEKGKNTSNPFRLKNSDRGEPVDKSLVNYRTSAELELEKVNIKAFYDTTSIKENRISDGRFDKTDFSSYGINAFGKHKYKTDILENIIFYGAEFERDDQNGQRQEMANTNDNRANLFPKGYNETTGAYLQSATKFGNFKMLLGARQDHYKIKAGEKSQSGSSDLLKKAVFSYTFVDVFTPFVRYSEGYRAPLIKETFASGDILNKASNPYIPKLNLIENPNLKPEYSKNYEAGFKFETEGFLEDYSTTSLNFTYFIQDVKDYIMQDPNCVIGTCNSGTQGQNIEYTFQYQNLNKVRFNGLEVEAKYSSDKYLLSITASTLKAEEPNNGNNILQTPSTKLIIKMAKKFESGLSLGLESISAGSVKSDKFRKYNISPLSGSGSPITNSGPPESGIGLSEETAGYSIMNFNVDYTHKTANFEGLYGVSLQNAFNVQYQDQTSYIPGLGRNINFYFKIKF